MILNNWTLEGNKLSLNVVKTSSMLISTKQTYKILKERNEGLQLNIDGDEPALVQSTGYLGVYIGIGRSILYQFPIRSQELLVS